MDPSRFTVRPARTTDGPEIVRLAAAMYSAMGVEADSDEWRRVALGAAERADGTGDTLVVVAEDPRVPGRLAAIAGAVIVRRLPGPANLAATAGYIQWVSTEPAWRRRGLARLVVSALLAWLDGRDVAVVELHATVDGEGLYRSLGFDGGAHPALRRRR
jgi:ribosomal protein S18 acetylase RimI-like enzyme